MGAMSVQEQITKLNEEVEQIKQEMSKLKNQLNTKKDQIKALKKKLSSNPSRSILNSFDDSLPVEEQKKLQGRQDLSKNELERLLLFDTLRTEQEARSTFSLPPLSSSSSSSTTTTTSSSSNASPLLSPTLGVKHTLDALSPSKKRRSDEEKIWLGKFRDRPMADALTHSARISFEEPEKESGNKIKKCRSPLITSSLGRLLDISKSGAADDFDLQSKEIEKPTEKKTTKWLTMKGTRRPGSHITQGRLGHIIEFEPGQQQHQQQQQHPQQHHLQHSHKIGEKKQNALLSQSLPPPPAPPPLPPPPEKEREKEDSLLLLSSNHRRLPGPQLVSSLSSSSLSSELSSPPSSSSSSSSASSLFSAQKRSVSPRRTSLSSRTKNLPPPPPSLVPPEKSLISLSSLSTSSLSTSSLSPSSLSTSLSTSRSASSLSINSLPTETLHSPIASSHSSTSLASSLTLTPSLSSSLADAPVAYNIAPSSPLSPSTEGEEAAVAYNLAPSSPLSPSTVEEEDPVAYNLAPSSPLSPSTKGDDTPVAYNLAPSSPLSSLSTKAEGEEAPIAYNLAPSSSPLSSPKEEEEEDAPIAYNVASSSPPLSPSSPSSPVAYKVASSSPISSPVSPSSPITPPPPLSSLPSFSRPRSPQPSVSLSRISPSLLNPKKAKMDLESTSLHKSGPLDRRGGERGGEKVRRIQTSMILRKAKVKDEREGEREKKGGALGQWSLRFQRCLKRLSQLDEGTAQVKRVDVNTELMHLNEDFVAASRAVGKIIISEVYLPFADKVIKPSSIGGCAGGEKYIVHNILFKFALDAFGLFGGSDLSASKVSGHELKGLMAYCSVGMEGVNFPLMTLVDYRGFRLVAISVLPVNKETLIYGTADGGNTYLNEENKFSRKMEMAAKSLNLKPHLCGTTRQKPVCLSAAADIEGHRGLDGKYYLLDFSRTMPPVTPDPVHFNGHLYYLFRREFVSRYPKRLCSDAYSGFISMDPNSKVHNQEVDDATDILFSKWIPECARSLYQIVAEFVESTTSLEKDSFFYLCHMSGHIHVAGVNLRYIGKVLNVIWEMEDNEKETREGEKGGTGTLALVQKLLLCEAVSRVVKNELSLSMREKTKELKLPLEVPYKKLAINILNLVFGRGEAPEKWWREILPPLLTKQFNISLKRREEQRGFDLREGLLMGKGSVRVALFRRIVMLTGLVFGGNVIKKFEDRSLRTTEPFDYLDLIEIEERVKCMDIVSLSQGNFFLFKANTQNDSKVKASLLLQAIEKYELALNSNVNIETLLQCSIAHYNYLLTKASDLGWKLVERNDELFFDKSDREVQRASKCFELMVRMDPNNSKSLCLSAMFLAKLHQLQEAEEHFLRSIRSHPNNSFALIEYLYFLDRCGLESAAKHVELLIEARTKLKVISPYSGNEIGGVVKVYGENGSFKSVSITATTTASDVLVMVCHSLKIPFNHMECQLVAVDAGISLKRVSEMWKHVNEWKRTIEMAKRKVVFSPTSLPWIFLQRPKNPFFLYLNRIVNPISLDLVLPFFVNPFLKWKSVCFSTRNDYLAFFDGDFVSDDQNTLAMLFISPLFISPHELKDFLIQNLTTTNIHILELWCQNFCDLPSSVVWDLVKVGVTESVSKREMMDKEEEDYRIFLQEMKNGGLIPKKKKKKKEKEGERGGSMIRLRKEKRFTSFSHSTFSHSVAPSLSSSPSSSCSISALSFLFSNYSSLQYHSFSSSPRISSSPRKRTPSLTSSSNQQQTSCQSPQLQHKQSSQQQQQSQTQSPKQQQQQQIQQIQFPQQQQTNFNKKKFFYIHKASQSEIKTIAKTLRLIAISAHFPIQQRDLLSFCSLSPFSPSSSSSFKQGGREVKESLILGMLYEKCITDWVVEEIDFVEKLQQQKEQQLSSSSTTPSPASSLSSHSSLSSLSSSSLFSPSSLNKKHNTSTEEKSSDSTPKEEKGERKKEKKDQEEEEEEGAGKVRNSLISFGVFIDLAIECCKLGDLSTSIAILEGLNSDTILALHPSWSTLPSHRPLRCLLESSLPYIHFSLSSSLTPSLFLQKYNNSLEILQKSSKIYLTNLGRCLSSLEAFTPLFSGGEMEGGEERGGERGERGERGGERGGERERGGGERGGKISMNLSSVLGLYDCVSRYGAVGMLRGSLSSSQVFMNEKIDSLSLAKLAKGPLRGFVSYLEN